MPSDMLCKKLVGEDKRRVRRMLDDVTLTGIEKFVVATTY
jgi:hypothetical protein